MKKLRLVMLAFLALIMITCSFAMADISDYEHLYYSSEGPAVTAVQEKLLELGYNFEVNEGVYDMELQKAIERFCKTNGIKYDRAKDNGISAELQYLLLEGEPVAYGANKNGGFMAGIVAHFTNTVSIAGIIVPVYFFWFAGIVLLAIIILIIVLAAQKGKKSRHIEDVTPPVVVSSPVQAGKSIKITINYNGNIQSIRKDIIGTLRIGRDMQTLPLDLHDHAISRKHCELYYLNDVLMLRDFSSNGTKVNGNLCSHAEQIINSGDTLTIGEHKLTISF